MSIVDTMDTSTPGAAEMLRLAALSATLLFIMWASCHPVWAQPAPEAPAGGLSQPLPGSTRVSPPNAQSAAAFEKYIADRNAVDQKYYKSYYEYLEKINEVQINKFIWQDRASEVTLWLVVIVVISGLSMSAFQLFIAFRRPDHSTDTTIDLSAQNFRVTSSVVGIVVLLISIGFLFLFLREVYNIKMVSIVENGGNAGESDAAAAARQQEAATSAPPQPS
jgi:hypothetical protein